MFQLHEGLAAFRGPQLLQSLALTTLSIVGELLMHLVEDIVKWSADHSEILDEPTMIGNHTCEFAYVASCLWNRHVQNGCNFVLVNGYAGCRQTMTKESNLWLSKQTLAWL